MSHRPSSFPDMTCQFVDAGRVQMLNRIGHGGWGIVYRAKDFSKGDAKLVAVKVVLKPRHKTAREIFLKREIDHHHHMSTHHCVVSVHRTFSDKFFVYIVLDYCPGGDMWKAFHEKAVFARNDGLVKHVFLQLIDAVHACHEQGIYHRDLKPNNILVNHDCTKVYLSDFGLSTRCKWTNRFDTGTKPYKSPECCNFGGMNKGYSTERGDIWALGVILVNMISGQNPWSEAATDNKAYLAYLRNPNYLRMYLPISKESDYILKRIFSLHEADGITLPALRRLVQSVQTFFMSTEEAVRAPGLKNIAKPYLYDDSDGSSEDEMVDDDTERYGEATSINSLEDDSDDSDEHSVAICATSHLAVDRDAAGAAQQSNCSHAEGKDGSKPSPARTTPMTPTNLDATPINVQQQSLLVPPSILLPPAGTSGSSTKYSSVAHSLRSSTTNVSQPSHKKQKGLSVKASSMLKSGVRLHNSVRRLFGARQDN